MSVKKPSLADHLVALDRADIADGGFKEFGRLAWPHVEPTPLAWNWHLDAIAEHLEAVAKRQIRDLVINVPPGSGKSRWASVLFPSWVWTFDPGRRFLCASFSEKLVLRDARAMRSLTSSAWYRARWPAVEYPRDDSASASAALYANTRKGFRKSETIRGQWTGEHGDDLLTDDPIDPMGAASTAELDACFEWYTGTMPTRFRDHTTSTRTLVMQRLHERDLTQEFKRAGATVLCLPMRFDPHHPDRYARDPRTTAGDLLIPARFPSEELDKVEKTLGPTRTAAQMQQRPVPAGGAIFRAEWFRRWTELPATGIWSMEVDATFRLTTDGSYVVIQVWCDDGPRRYLVDQRRERMGFNSTLAAIRAMRAQWPKARTVRIEGKANGDAVMDVLRAEIGGIVEVQPDGGKEARANACQGEVAAGDVYLPDETHARYPDGRVGAPWVPGFLHEAISFPKGESDDQVDAMTQHLNAVGGSYASRLRAAMGKQ